MTNPFIPVTIQTSSGPVELTGQRVSEHFAITPTTRGDSDGRTVLDRGVALTHIPTGLRVTSDSWSLDLAKLGEELQALPIDWASLTKLTDEQGQLVKEVFDRLRFADDDSGWPWPKWAGDESKPATSIIAGRLDAHLEDKFSEASNVAREAKALLPEDLGKKVDAWIVVGWSKEKADAYAIAYLMAVLQRIDPESADRAARDLVGQWDSGDCMGEFVYKWREQLAQGKPLHLPGFPEMSLPVEGGAA